MSEPKIEEIKKIIIEYIGENVDPENKELVENFDRLIEQLELQNI